MSKISYSTLKLKLNTEINTFDFQGHTIEVLKYLPIEDKYDLIMITLQKSEENGIFNPLKLDVFFHLHLVYMYTNLTFTDKQREDELKLYDCLKSNGFIDQLLIAFDEDEYNDLFETFNDMVKKIVDFRKSTTYAIQDLLTRLPENAQAAADIVENFDPKQYQAVVDFATAANGGRPIN